MKKINFKGRKHAVTATCLLVGMFMLTTAVYANYDDARGYTNYKDAAKDLMFYQDNFSAKGQMSILVDDEVYATFDGELKLDGEDQFMSAKESSGFESEETTIGSQTFSYFKKDNTYRVSENYGTFRGGIDADDPSMKKAIRFMELFADTMVGDLKNNFVLASNEDGNRNYSVNVSGSQIPEVINAGLSLMFTAANTNTYYDENPSMVTFENYNEAFNAYYEEQTGEKLTQGDYESWTEEMENLNTAFYIKYEDALASKNDKGIIFVKADGEYDYYKTYDEYRSSADFTGMSEVDILPLLGNDPYIENAVCNFTLDEDGNIIKNQMEASMSGVDKDGKKHTVTMKINFELSDYGTTTVAPFDTEGKTKLN